MRFAQKMLLAGLDEIDYVRTQLSAIEAHEAARYLQRDVKTYVGTSIQVELRAEGGVERSMGKAKRVVDLRPR